MNMLAKVDQDDVCGDTISTWIRRYNRKYNDNLKVEDIQDWNLTQYVKCGNKIYDFLNSKTLYNYVKPIPYALDGINKLRSIGFDIAFVTAGRPEHSVYKLQWLKNHNFWQEGDHYINTFSKHLICGDLFIDDNYQNILNSNSSCNLLMSKPWNLKYEYKNRVSGWQEIIADVDRYLESL